MLVFHVDLTSDLLPFAICLLEDLKVSIFTSYSDFLPNSVSLDLVSLLSTLKKILKFQHDRN